jgi:Zn-dependent membrane protease YugP
MSGAEIAEKMLADNGIRDVRVISPGRLTDHYNPSDKTVNLSRRFITSVKCQLLLQLMNVVTPYNMGYEWLTMRSKLVPVVNVALVICSGFCLAEFYC